VLRAVVDVLRNRAGFGWAGIAFVQAGALKPGPEAGEPGGEEAVYPVTFQGGPVAELRVAPGPTHDAGDAFLRRVALLISPQCRR
jgi:hypothetical protein